jgi:hypothetical protein
MPCCRCFSSERGSSFSYMERRWSISIGNRGVGMTKCLVEKHQNTSKRIMINQNVSKRIKTDQNASKSIKTDQNVSKSIKTHQTYQKVTTQCCRDNLPHQMGFTNLPKNDRYQAPCPHTFRRLLDKHRKQGRRNDKMFGGEASKHIKTYHKKSECIKSHQNH